MHAIRGILPSESAVKSHPDSAASHGTATVDATGAACQGGIIPDRCGWRLQRFTRTASFRLIVIFARKSVIVRRPFLTLDPPCLINRMSTLFSRSERGRDGTQLVKRIDIDVADSWDSSLLCGYRTITILNLNITPIILVVYLLPLFLNNLWNTLKVSLLFNPKLVWYLSPV